jgi:hypothetical protein
MIYTGYNFDLNDNIIILDEELKLVEQANDKSYGNLPAGWKQGDTFRLTISANNTVCLIKVNKDETT